MQKPSRTTVSFGGPLTPVVKVLIWANVLVFLFLLIAGQKNLLAGRTYTEIATMLLGLSPVSVKQDFAIWQMFTYMFVHLAFFHLLFNMLALWWFGSDLEAYWGSRHFLQYYLFTGIGAGLVSVLLNIPTIGASGAVFGLLFSYGISFPNRLLYLYFVFPVKAKYCVMIFGAIELIALMTANGQTNINHAAHLSGIAFGFVWFVLYRRNFNIWRIWQEYQLRRKRKKFRVIRSDEEDRIDPFNNQTIH